MCGGVLPRGKILERQFVPQMSAGMRRMYGRQNMPVVFKHRILFVRNILPALRKRIEQLRNMCGRKNMLEL